MDEWGWPQWVFAVLYVFGVCMSAARDGEPKTGKHSFPVTVVATAIGAWILYMGGFWQ